MTSLKRKLLANLKNIGLPVIRRKLIIFESDDWGSNRMPSVKDFKGLVKDGVLSGKPSHYDINDTIARASDLEVLFDALNMVKDHTGRNAVFTPFVNVANPDFEKIENSGFQNYYWEDFFTTLEKTGEKTALSGLWKQGIENGIFDPAFHGREHLCVPLWLKHLKDENSLVRKAFKHHFYSVPIEGLPVKLNAFRPALFFSHPDQVPFLKHSIMEGMEKMKSLFNKSPKVFCPPNGISHKLFDEASSLEGIKTIMANRLRPEPNGKGGLTKIFYPNGSKNQWGQKYYQRNCAFEPTYSADAVNFSLMQIEAAFRWFKPAIISTHRVNYIGSLNPANRERGIAALKTLLKEVVKRWPDVEFISSNEFSDILHKTDK